MAILFEMNKRQNVVLIATARRPNAVLALSVVLCFVVVVFSPAFCSQTVDYENLEGVELMSVFPTFGMDVHHVQGLYMTDEHIFFTSVDKYSAKGWLHKFDRRTMKLVASRNLAKGLYVHPSGFDYGGGAFWIAMAVYKRETASRIFEVDPETLKARIRFEVEDHIGLVARDGDIVIGANWNAELFYFWEEDGNLLHKRVSPTGVGYQDCKADRGFLVCVSGNKLDVIDLKEWRLIKRMEIGDSQAGNAMGREGVALRGGRVYFLPDDGMDARVYEFRFVPSVEQSALD
jgi:hypothetical protein